jgi:hypothetical protein
MLFLNLSREWAKKDGKVLDKKELVKYINDMDVSTLT